MSAGERVTYYEWTEEAETLDCTWCGGDGIEEQCINPLECFGPHDKLGGGCPCGACGGTGLRSKQTVF